MDIINGFFGSPYLKIFRGSTIQKMISLVTKSSNFEVFFRPERMDSDEFDEFDDINEVPLHQRIGKTGAASNAHKDVVKNAGTKRKNAETRAKSAKTTNFLSGKHF